MWHKWWGAVGRQYGSRKSKVDTLENVYVNIYRGSKFKGAMFQQLRNARCWILGGVTCYTSSKDARNVLDGQVHCRARTKSVVVFETKHRPRTEADVIRRNHRYREPVSFAGKINWPVRWSPKILAQRLTVSRVMLTEPASNLKCSWNVIFCNILQKHFWTHVRWTFLTHT